MDPRDVLRYSVDSPDKTIINQIMLRFRPIAPKPAITGSDSDLAARNNKDLLISKRRTKRKYVRVGRNNNNRLRKNQRVSDQEIGIRETAVTLQLLPEEDRDEMRKSAERERERSSGCNLKLKEAEVDQTREESRRLESWVRVESVTETFYACMEEDRGLTDVERVKNLEGEEERPGFISDASDKVRWVNGAYKRMMMMKREEGDEEEEISVCLVSQQKLVPFVNCCAFTCWVRLQDRMRLGEKEKLVEKTAAASKMVPCDVWRMDCGGFAWRLDIKAALSLSLDHY